MRLYAAAAAIVAALSTPFSFGFVPSHRVASSVRIDDIRHDNAPASHHHLRILRPLHSTTEQDTVSSPSTVTSKKKKKLGLITFDLDDTLYPIAPVLDEANRAFSTAMSNFGYVDIQPSDIVEAGKQIRAQVTEDVSSGSADSADPLKPSTVNHKEIRLAAIRREMEQFILKTKLKQTAMDWATDVEDLTSPVRKSAEK
jgi:hypothetical protein